MRKGIFILVFILLFINSLAFAETIELKSGKKIEAKIIEKTDKYIKVDIYGAKLTYWLDEIASIQGEPIIVEQMSIKEEAEITTAVEKTAEQIFAEFSPSVVVITATSGIEGGLGSGVVIDKNGLIATNYHVLAQGQDARVKLKDGRTFPIEHIVGYDVVKDICILKIDASDLTAVTLADSDKVKIGQKVLAIGNPLGLEYTLSDGIVSSVRDVFGVNWIQFSAPISPGSSGGPVLDMYGRVIGITTFVRVQGQNLSFASPINNLKPFIKKQKKISYSEFSNPSSTQAKLYYTKGIKAFHNGDSNTAINNLEKSLGDPECSFAYVVLGQAYTKIGNYQKAIEYLEQAVLFYPDVARVFSMLGIAYNKVGDFYNAIANYEKEIKIEIAKINPDEERIASAYISLGYVYYFTAQPQKAISSVEEALRFNSDKDTEKHGYLILGSTYNALGNKFQANKYLNKLREMGANKYADDLEREMNLR